MQMASCYTAEQRFACLDRRVNSLLVMTAGGGAG